MSTQNYKVLSNVRHSGHNYLPDDLIELNKADAGPLLALRHPAIAVIDDQLEVAAATEPAATEPAATEPAATEKAATKKAATKKAAAAKTPAVQD